MTDEPQKLSDLTRVRIASPEEEEELFAMCARLHAENAVFPMNPAKVRDFLRRVLAQRDAVMGVIGDSGKLEGSICLVVEQGDWYTDAWALLEKWNYVLPEYRRSDNAKQLVEFAKAVALTVKLPLLIGILSNERTEAKVRLYERKLGPMAGAFWLHGAKTGMAEHVRR